MIGISTITYAIMMYHKVIYHNRAPVQKETEITPVEAADSSNTSYNDSYKGHFVNILV